MSTAETKLDQQTYLIKWILGGVAAGLIAIGGFAVSTFTAFMNDKKESETYLKNDVKEVLVKLSESNGHIAQSIDTQTQVMKDLRDITKRGAWRDEPTPTEYAAKAPE